MGEVRANELRVIVWGCFATGVLLRATGAWRPWTRIRQSAPRHRQSWNRGRLFPGRGDRPPKWGGRARCGDELSCGRLWCALRSSGEFVGSYLHMRKIAAETITQLKNFCRLERGGVCLGRNSVLGVSLRSCRWHSFSRFSRLHSRTASAALAGGLFDRVGLPIGRGRIHHWAQLLRGEVV